MRILEKSKPHCFPSLWLLPCVECAHLANVAFRVQSFSLFVALFECHLWRLVYFVRPGCPVPHQVSEISKSRSHQLWGRAHSSSHQGENKAQLQRVYNNGYRLMVEMVVWCHCYRMEACSPLEMARGASWATAPPPMSFYPDECWSWWVLRCPRSPVAGTGCSKLRAPGFISACI